MILNPNAHDSNQHSFSRKFHQIILLNLKLFNFEKFNNFKKKKIVQIHCTCHRCYS